MEKGILTTLMPTVPAGNKGREQSHSYLVLRKPTLYMQIITNHMCPECHRSFRSGPSAPLWEIQVIQSSR